jgi:hypothetical protein
MHWTESRRKPATDGQIQAAILAASLLMAVAMWPMWPM